MTLQEVLNRLQILGLSYCIKNTKHWDWKRVYIIDPDNPNNNKYDNGQFIGRMHIDRDNYYSSKWYHSAKKEYPLRWIIWETYNLLLSTEQIKEAKRLALEKSTQRYNEKIAYRIANPHPKGLDKFGKDRRQKIQPPDSYEYFYGIIKELYQCS